MCNCYSHKCECCDELIPMHIADFAYPKTDFQIWCGKHINRAEPGAVIFKLIEDEDGEYPPGWKCAILGPEACANGPNTPNISGDFRTKLKE